MVSGEDDPTWDAGLIPLASIGDYVWEDINADGIQDAGEAPIGGVTVDLYDGGGNFVATTTTAADGSYGFTDLIPGDYYVDFTLPVGYMFSPQDQGGDDTVDSDADTTTGETAVTTLDPGENDPTWDAGLIPLASIGDFVWSDLNADGIQDAGEPGIGGVTVDLYDGGGNFVATTTTAADGSYGFTNLVPGDYYVDFIAPAGYSSSPQDQGGDDTADSDADVATGETAVTTLDPGENDPTWDAGFYQPASLGDFVWEDLNADGIQDAGELGIGGVTVDLYDGGGNFVATTTTAADGSYGFTNLVPGDYYVDFTAPAGYVPSPQDQGGDDTVDSDADTTSGETIVTTLVAGENDLTWDAGFYQLASLGDYVWEDINADGIQDAGEVGVAGVTVDLYDGGGNFIATTTTAADGSYSFTNLMPGDYYVDFTLPTGYVFSPQDQGGDDTVDSDADTTTGETAVTTLTSGEDDPTWDAGLIPLASIGDYVWEDINADGIQDAGEAPIGGVTVDLYDGGGNFIATTTTAADGSYGFTNLMPGDYYVDFTTPAGYMPSPQDQGGDDTVDSDADVATGETAVTTLDPGENDPTWDAGFIPLASIGDFVWEDLNADGIQDAGELGIGGVTVDLYDGGGNFVATTTTAADGSYGFTDLIPGDYYVDFIAPAGYIPSAQDQGGDDTVDSDADVATGETAVTTLDPGENDPTWDAGFYQLASIGDYVWEDINADGIQDAGEVGVGGVTVDLYDGGGNFVATTTTAADGSYGFTNLMPGDYYVDFTLPSGYVFSPQDQGGDDTVDSDADTTTGETAVTTLTSGEDDPTWDAGLIPLASIGDYVWEDINADGIQDAGETGIGGVTVDLYDGGGNFVATTTTAADGSYGFTDLIPGDYYVDFTTPVGYAPSPQDQGGDDTVDSDADVATGETAVTTLDPGENDPTWDAGFFIPASIGDYVWEDINADGIQDGSENGVAGVTVDLYDGGGNFIATTTTAADGSYSFTNLVPGDYYVDFTLPSGYIFSPQDQGGDDTVDSDADTTTGETIVTNLVSGEDDPTWDAGLIPLASIGDFVWLDDNLDGIQDAGETGVGGVTVNLYDVTNTIILTTTTAPDGSYLFDNLIPGDYHIEFVPPAGYAISPQDQGGDDTVDSDADTTTGETIVTTLDPGEDDPTWDAGIFLMVPDIVIHKDVSIARVVPNQLATVTYTLRVTNTGNIPITTVNITDTLPANMTFVPGSATPTETSVVGQTITWNDVTSGVPFAPGASITVTFEADLPTAIGNYVNNAGVIGITPVGTVDDQDDVTVVVEDPSVELDKEVVAPGIVGDLITYTIQITNTGPSVIEVLPMVDTFSGPMEYVGGTPIADLVDNVNQGLAWNDLTTHFGNLAPGQGITIVTVFRITSPDSEVTLTNNAQVIGAEDAYTNPTNEPDDDVILINVPTAVSLTSFTAVGHVDGTVDIEWVTESELDNFGFELYRSDVDSFESAESIYFESSVVGSGPGKTYTYQDTVPNDGVWYYWLVDIDTSGVETIHGPVTINASGINEVFYTIFLPMVIR